MAERILARGEGGAGGWLESACKGILTFRAGILLITVVALWGEDGDKTLPAAAILVGRGHVVDPAALLGPRRAGARAPSRPTWRPSSCWRR